MKAKIISDVQEFSSLEEKWNDLLNHFAYKDISFSHSWYANWIKAFHQNRKVKIIMLEMAGQFLSALPMIEDKISYLHLNVNVLASMTNWHSNRFDVISRYDSAEILEKMIETAFLEGQHQMLTFNFVPEDSFLLKWIEVICRERKWSFIKKDFMTNCLVKKESTFDEFFEKIDGKFRRNVKAAERKALDRGPLELVHLQNEKELENFLERGFKIEATGWKGEKGTAINCSKNVKEFYDGIAKDFFKRGELNAYLLKSGDDDIAFLYCIKSNQIIRALKIGSHENFRNIGPGMLITKEVLKHLHDGQFTVWDFCGGEARWKNDWSNDKEKLYSLTLFNNSFLGKSLYKLGSYAH